MSESSKYLASHLFLFLIAGEVIVFTHHVFDYWTKLHHSLLHRNHKTMHLGKNLILITTICNYLTGLSKSSVKVLFNQFHLLDTFPLNHSRRYDNMGK